MLISLLLKLRAVQDAVLPKYLGRANYAALLARLNVVEHGFGDAVHAREGPKPLTCSNLFTLKTISDLSGGQDRQNDFQMIIRTGDEYGVHITGLTQLVSTALTTGFVEQPPTTWTVGGCRFQIIESVCNTDVDCWTGCTTYESLAAKPILEGRPFGSQVILSFLSPTSFQSNNLHMPLPLPNLVFGSLVDRWNYFSSLITLPNTLRTQLLDTVAISQYELRSQAVPQKNGDDGRSRKQKGERTPLHIGAEGIVTYTLANKQIEHRQRVELTSKLQTLANFAMYSGVGVKTTTGMGQCRHVMRAPYHRS